MLQKNIPNLIGVHFYREFRFNFARVSIELSKEGIRKHNKRSEQKMKRRNFLYVNSVLYRDKYLHI